LFATATTQERTLCSAGAVITVAFYFQPCGGPSYKYVKAVPLNPMNGKSAENCTITEASGLLGSCGHPPQIAPHLPTNACGGVPATPAIISVGNSRNSAPAVRCKCDPATFLNATDYHGNDLKIGYRVASDLACCRDCCATAQCKFWTYGSGSPMKELCWLKHAETGLEPQSNRRSGQITFV